MSLSLRLRAAIVSIELLAAFLAPGTCDPQQRTAAPEPGIPPG